MLPSAHSSRTALLACPALLASIAGLAYSQAITREGNHWVSTITRTVPAAAHLKVIAHGPVTVEGGGAGRTLTYTVKLAVTGRTQEEAHRLLEIVSPRIAQQGAWTVFTAPAAAAMASLVLKVPRLESTVISTSEGSVRATGIDGKLEIETAAGEIAADRITGDARLMSGGGELHIGDVLGSLQCRTGVGPITVKNVRGEAVLQTSGGDVMAGQCDGPVRAETGGGGVHIHSAAGPVNVTSGGGEVIVDKASGPVTVRSLAGDVQVGSAAGVRCESGAGGIHISSVSGPMRVSTSAGSILARLFGKLADSYVATGDGDITVWIPSNVGVNVQAQNTVPDMRRIISDFREIHVRRQGPLIIAQGAVNGGGPLLQLVGMGGTIAIKKEK